MGQLFCQQCDICNEIQQNKEAHLIKGTTYTENGINKFCCSTCSGKLKTALSLGKGGLDDPLKAAALLLEQKDNHIRNLEMQASAKSGGMMGAADELRRKRESGGFIPVMGLDFEGQYKQARILSESGGQSKPHALPAPESKNKPKKRKK